MASLECCKKCGSQHIALGLMHTASGSTVRPWYCQACGHVSTVYASKNELLAYARLYGSPKFVKSNINQNPPCERCGQDGTEYHHWAPQYLFEDADKWPGSYLCVKCHKEWHNKVTHDMSEPRE